MTASNEAREHVREAANEARTGAGRVVEHLKEAGHEAKVAATEQIGHMADQAGDYYRRGKERAMEWEGTLEDCVRERPIRSLLIAAGVGLLLGAVWRR